MKRLTEFSKLTFVCIEEWGTIRHTSRCFPKMDPRGFPRSLEFQLTDVFLASVCILSQYSWVFSIEVREILPILPNVFRISFSETTLCLALLSLLSMPFKCTPWRQYCVVRQAIGFRLWSDLILARSVLPAFACYCLRLSVRLHVSFSSLQRIKCIPKPTAKLRASASPPGPCLEQSLYWLPQKIAPLLHGLSS